MQINKVFKEAAPAQVTCRHHPSKGTDTCREMTDSVVDLWVELEGVAMAKLRPLSQVLVAAWVVLVVVCTGD